MRQLAYRLWFVMRVLPSSLILLLFLLFAASPLLAQSTTLSLHGVDDTNFPQMSVIVSAWEGGTPIGGLSSGDFTVTEESQTVPTLEVTTLDSSEVPASVILVLDTSTSMQAGNAIVDAQAAAISVLDRLKPNDRVALLAFSDEINPDVNQLAPGREIAFTTDKEQVRAAINGLQALGPTPLFDATIKAIRLSANEPPGSRAMILLTDGRDERLTDDGQSVPASTLTNEDAISEAREIGMPIFTIGLGVDVDQQFLERLADQSRGAFVSVEDSAQLGEVFIQATENLLQRYVIRYQSQVAPDNRSHGLQVQLNRAPDASVQGRFIARAPDVPTIALDLQENQEVQGDVVVRPRISARDAISNVELLVDGESIAQSNSEPYELIWPSADPRWFEPPNHTLTIRVTDEGGDVGEQNVVLVVRPPEAAPEAEAPPEGEVAPEAPPEGEVAPEAPPEGEVAPEAPPEGEAAPEGEQPAPQATPAVGDPPEEPFELLDWLPFFLLGLAILLFVVVLVVWLRGRRNNSDVIQVAPPVSLAPAASTGPSLDLGETLPPPSVFPDAHLHNGNTGAPLPSETPFDATALAPGGLPSAPTPSAPTPSAPTPSAPLSNETIADAPANQTVILGQKPTQLAYLAEVEGQRPGHTHRISSQRVSIGRDPRSQIQLHDRSVGRQQAVIIQQEDQFFLHDMAASNPTLLNGQQVVGRTLLHDRDMIELGTTKLQFIMLDKNGI